MTPSFDTRHAAAELSPGFLLWKVSNLHRAMQRQALAALNLTPTEFSVLACYGDLERRGRVTQSDVCAHASLDKMVVSAATRNLIAKGFLERSFDAADRRAAVIALTRAGRTACNRALRIIEPLDEAFFAASGDGETFSRQLRDILTAAKE
ncbi:MAG: hypothetical protein B7C55_10170 [Actinomycetales bacterium mxb001]|nr:MAG: hypothetical protein B7C55_10170 [Actinomycetales bacterium mxb001]